MSTIKFNSSADCRVAVADWDETILDAFLRSGAPVPFFCRAGICGQCKSILVAGEVEPVGVPSHLLTAAERQRGVILLCSSRAVSDCEIQAVNNIISNDPTAWPTRFEVESCVSVHSTLLRIRLFAIPHEMPFSFRAGQSTRFSDPEFASLPSIFLASRPSLPYVDLYFSLDDRLWAMAEKLEPGSVVALSAPTGSASLRDGELGPLVVFAEGAGIASALGMMETIAALGSTAPATAFVLRGSANGSLERRVIGLAQAAGIDASVAITIDDVPSAIEKALSEVETRSPYGKVRAYVKAGRETAKAVRKVLLQHEVRPWDTHVDNVPDQKP